MTSGTAVLVGEPWVGHRVAVTDEHATCSYGQAVVIVADGTPRGPAEIGGYSLDAVNVDPDPHDPEPVFDLRTALDGPWIDWVRRQGVRAEQLRDALRRAGYVVLPTAGERATS